MKQHLPKFGIPLPTLPNLTGGTSRLFLPLMLLFATLTVAAQEESHPALSIGSGTPESPYIITTLTDYKAFADKVNGGETSICAKLEEDISDINFMVGDNKPFTGTFDGNGHTLNVNITSNSDIVAPFRNAQGATFRNLHVTGTVTTSKKYAGGLVGNVAGPALTISGCNIAVAINTSVNGDGTHGGIVAVNSAANVTNSLFSGSINGSQTHSCGGFLGWSLDGNEASITNCLNVGTFTVKADGGSATFIRGTNHPITHSYYKNAYGTAQGEQASDEQLTSGELAWNLQHYAETSGNSTAIAWGQILGSAEDSVDTYPVPTIDDSKRVYRAQYLVGDKVVFTSYANKGQEFAKPTKDDLGVSELNIPEMNPAGNDTSVVITAENTFSIPKGEHFTVTVTRDGVELQGGETISMTDKLTYTVTADNDYRLLSDATFTLNGNEAFPKPAVLPVDEDGFVKIANIDDWNMLAKNYNNEHQYALTADINDVTTMVGTEAKPFTTTFDGRGHTLTLKYELADSAQDAQQVVGPFRYVNGATITNLRTAGTISTKKNTNDAGGIIGRVINTATLTNCESSVENNFGVSGDATNGGLIGRVVDNASVNIDNCAFKGKFNATNGGNCFGGFIGYVDNGAKAAYISNSLMAGTFNVSKANNAEYGNAAFARRSNGSRGKVVVTNSYYLQNSQLEVTDEQGKAVAADSLKLGAVAHHLQAQQKTLAWGQKLTGESVDALPVVTSTDSLRVYQATFTDKNNGNVYYTYANAGQKFPVPTTEQLGVKTVETTYNNEVATADISVSISAYSDKLKLTIPTSNRYTVTVTREGTQLNDGDEILDTDELVYKITAERGFVLLSESEMTLTGKDTLSTPATLMEENGYALISNADEWNLMAKYCDSQNYRLTDDINVNTTVGTKQKPFIGIFDGQRHTITVDYNIQNTDDVAPFSIIKNATIKNVNIKGTIQTNMQAGDAAGLVGEANGKVTIDNVQIGTILNWTRTGASTDMTSAGIVGRVNNDCNITMNNCLFNGTINGNEGSSVAGFIGWAHGSNVSVNISNSLVAGTFNVQKANNGFGNQSFARRDGNARVTINNSYYLPYSNLEFNNQGTAVSDTQLKSGAVTYSLQGKQESLIWVQKIGDLSSDDAMPQLSNETAKRVYSVSYTYNGSVVYAVYGNTGDKVELPGMDDEKEIKNFKLPSYLTATGLKESSVTIYESDESISLDGCLKLQLPTNDRYTVTATLGGEPINNGDVLSGTGDLVFHVVGNDGYMAATGRDQVMKTTDSDFADFVEPYLMPVSDDGYCLISTIEEWNYFAANNPDGKFRLTKDLGDNRRDKVKTMIGTSDKPFKGTFDGNGHTIYIYYYTDEPYTALFRFVDGATIKNLHVIGSFYSKKQFAGGFVGATINNPSTFTDCWSTVDMLWGGGEYKDMTWGGFVGVSRAGASFNNCLFDGVIHDSYTDTTHGINTGGFVGWTDKPVSIKNSVVAAEIRSTSRHNNKYFPVSNATFCRNPGLASIDNCFFLSDKISGSKRSYNGWQGKELNSNDALLKDGTLAYMLQGADSVQHWGQTIGRDNMPVLTSDVNRHVFKNVYDGDNNAAYANTFNVDEAKGNKANIDTNAAATGNVKLNRTFAEGWNTLVLPFSLTTEEVNKAFGDTTKVAYFSNSNANTIELNTKEDTKDIAANTPVLIKPANVEGTEFNFGSKTIMQTDEPKAVGDNGITFIGSYESLFTVPKDDYYFISGKSLWKSLGTTTIKATRAYFHAPELLTAKLRLFIDGVEADDTATGIEGVKSDESGNRSYGSAVYTLSGQKVADNLNEARKANLKQGVYIVNGKKVVIK